MPGFDIRRADVIDTHVMPKGVPWPNDDAAPRDARISYKLLTS